MGIGTLKEILSVYQNLSKLVQLQSNTLKTTISGFESLCNENRDRNHYPQHNDDEDRVDLDVLQRYSNCRNVRFIFRENEISVYRLGWSAVLCCAGERTKHADTAAVLVG